LWCNAQGADFREIVLLAANLGHDADTTAAIAGQLAGARFGLTGIPQEWLAKVAWSDRLVDAAGQLLTPSG
jgi:ADP-ribosyl-[dinitrogen reductase] hydrolase